MNSGDLISSRAVQGRVCVGAEPQPEYRVTLTLTVRHADALWDAAVSRAMNVPDTLLEDVVDVIGPREDPSISDCLTMLMLPRVLPGCEPDDFWVDSLPGHSGTRDLLRIS